MKLLEKNSAQFFRFTSFILLGCALLLFISMYFILRWGVDEELVEKSELIAERIALGDALPSFVPLIEVKTVEKLSIHEAELSKVYLPDEEGEEEPYRQLVQDIEVNGGYYRLVLRDSMLEADELLWTLSLSIVLILLCLFIGLKWLNARSTHKLWAPFYDHLERIKKFRVDQKSPLQLQASAVDEFDELKAAVEYLSDKIQKDYHSLKEFTENASHELQTPLAIINANIETCLQSTDLSREQARLLADTQRASLRLSRIVKGLLTLSRLDNQQAGAVQTVDLNALISEHIDYLQEMVVHKDLRIRHQSDEDACVQADPELVSMLVKNLLENAIKYSPGGTEIHIRANALSLNISNSGIERIQNPQRIFERFKKESTDGNALGLGLAIVQKICQLHQWHIAYRWERSRHFFEVKF